MRRGDGEPQRWCRRDLVALAAATLAGIGARVFYLSSMGPGPYDPWRHLTLIRRLRSGEGFTLFGDQPYIWYQALWYRVSALLADAIAPSWLAGALSAATVVLVYVWIRSLPIPSVRVAASVAAALAAVYGPLLNVVCHPGSEAFSLCLTVSALVLVARRSDLASAGLAGVFFGLASMARLNFLFSAVASAGSRWRRAARFRSLWDG
jgi:hypothetical protein